MKNFIPQKLSLPIILGLSSLASAIPLTEQVDLVGQLRTRTEYNKINTSSAFDEGFAQSEMRTRLGVVVRPDPKLNFRIEFQDSRVMGNETPAVEVAPHTSTLSNTGNVDLHQAFVEIDSWGLKTKVGRQKFFLGSQRLLSSLEWHPNARVFDGVSQSYQSGNNTLKSWAFWVHNANARPNADIGATGQDDGIFLVGLHDELKINKELTAEVYGMYDNSQVGGVATQNWDLFYLGERLKGTYGNFFFEEEIIAQLGEITPNGSETQTSLAVQTALRLGYKLPTTKLTLGHDLMSGDLDGSDDELNTYMNNHAFAHAYFGWMDYVLVNRANTNNEGIQDIRFDIHQNIGKSLLKVEYHHFRSVANADNHLGDELDLELHLKVLPKANIVLGAAVFLPGDESAVLNQAGDENGYYFYLMPVFNF